MLSLTPPLKVARSQRCSVGMCNGGPTYISSRASELHQQVKPTSIEHSIVQLGELYVDPSEYLSGIGQHLCWLVDSNKKLVRLWNLASQAWRRTEPRVAEIPYFVASEEGLPLFVSEMDQEESLAFCSERGSIASLDHSIEFQLLDGDETMTVSCFSCMRRSDCGDVILCAVGTCSGLLVTDVKCGGVHYTRQFDRLQGRIRSRGDRIVSRSIWSSLKSLVGLGGARGRGSVGTREASHVTSVSQECTNLSGMCDPFRFTHVLFRKSYPDEQVAANAAGEVMLLEFGPELCRRDAVVEARWLTDMRSTLGADGTVLALAETRHKVLVLFLVDPHPERNAFPSLVLATLGVAEGNMIHQVNINSAADLVKAAAEAPPHHIRLCADDNTTLVLLSVRGFFVRVNHQVGIHSPCSGEDTVILSGVQQPLGSVLLPGGTVVTLDHTGPVVTMEGISSTTDLTGAYTEHGVFMGSDSFAFDVDRCLAQLRGAVRVDGKISLDAAVLGASEDLSVQRGVLQGNWARTDMNAEDESIVLHVTRHLRRRQQQHRQFVCAVLQHPDLPSELQATTIAQLISTQEELLGLVALRSMQNVGSVTPFNDSAFRIVRSLFASAPSDAFDAMHLVNSTEQLERCQQILRRCIIRVSDHLRERGTGQAVSSRSTAAELVFSSPSHLVTLLRTIGEYLAEVLQSVVVQAGEKFEDAYAAGCVFVVASQAVVESREELAKFYVLSGSVRALLWTASQDATAGAQTIFDHICIALSNGLAQTFLHPSDTHADDSSERASPTSFASRMPRNVITVPRQCHLLDIISYLLYFSFTCHTTGDGLLCSKILRQSILRAPFVEEPLGYPYGPPRAARYAPELGLRILHISESIALTFDAVDVLLDLCLASPVEDPIAQREYYQKLEAFCLRNPCMLQYALDGLLKQNREWELLCLPSVLQHISDAEQQRDAFLEQCAPHLVWLAAPSHFEALLQEGATLSVSLPYGPTALSHRSRCVAVSRLGWVAAGAPASAGSDKLQLHSKVVAAQRKFLSHGCDGMVLGPSDLVQRLLSERNVEAWVTAAEVACCITEALGEDLLVQVLRCCREYDREAIQRIAQDCVSDLETMQQLQATAIGRVMQVCAPLQERSTMNRLCESVLSVEERKLLSSWMPAYCTGGVQSVSA